MRSLNLALLLLLAGAIAAPPEQAAAQQPTGPAIKASVGMFSPWSPLVFVEDGSYPSARLPDSPAVGLEVEYRFAGLPWLGLYAAFTGAFSQLDHSSLMALDPANGPRSRANLYVPSGGLVLSPFDWTVRPTVRLGAGLKLYDFTWIEHDSDGFVREFTGDVGVGLESGAGPVVFFGEARWLFGEFDPGFLPTRVNPPARSQHDWVFQIGFRFGSSLGGGSPDGG